MVVVAGGSPKHPLPPGCVPIVAWLRRFASRIPTIVSVCVGAFLLGEAGLLDGRRATTHWLHVRELAERFPRARVVDDGIFVEDGRVWTSAGVTAGIDLALALVERHQGHAVAMAVAKRMVLFLRRSGQQAQFSAPLRRQEKAPPELVDLTAFVLEHLDEHLPVVRLAAEAGMSVRTLHRFCREHFDESPAEFVRRLRLDEARRLLSDSALPLKDVTAKSGLGDPATMWRVFVQHLGVSPVEYRQRFAARGNVS
jgi:transcriptional regulator GlxA family with amidase domain